jgi:hypothetical protein
LNRFSENMGISLIWEYCSPLVYIILIYVYIYIYHILPLHIPYAPCMEYESQHLPEQHHPNVGKYTMKKHGKKGNTWDMLISSSIQGYFFFRTKPNLNISKTHISLYEYTAHDSLRLYLPEDWSQNGGLASIAHWKGNLCYTMECWSTSPVAKNWWIPSFRGGNHILGTIQGLFNVKLLGGSDGIMNACLRFGNCNDWQNNNAHVRICYILVMAKNRFA